MLENALEHIKNYLWRKLFRLNYHRIRLKLPVNPRKQKCQCCATQGWTNIHHWKYAYTYTQIRENNNRALENTSELCFPCHELGNALRKLFAEDPLLKVKTTSKKMQKLLELREKALKEGAKT